MNIFEGTPTVRWFSSFSSLRDRLKNTLKEMKWNIFHWGGVGDFMVTFSLFQKKIGFMLVFTIIEWSQK